MLERQISVLKGNSGGSRCLNRFNSRDTKPTDQERSEQDSVTEVSINSDILNSISSHLGISNLSKMSLVSKDWRNEIQPQLKQLRFLDLILGIPRDSKPELKRSGFIGVVNNFDEGVNYSDSGVRSNVEIKQIDSNKIRISIVKHFVNKKESESKNHIINEIIHKLSDFGLTSDESLARIIVGKVKENGEQYLNCDVLKILMEATPFKTGPLVEVVDEDPRRH